LLDRTCDDRDEQVSPVCRQCCASATTRVSGKAHVSFGRLHIGQLVISALNFQVRWRPVTDIWFAFVTLQHDHDAKPFGLLQKDTRSRGKEFAEECNNNVLMAYGDAFGPRSTRRFAPHRATLRVSRPFG
jgi:hypothetical protein